MAAQQGAWQEGCKIYKGLSQQGCHFLQSSFQLCRNAVKANKNRSQKRKLEGREKKKGGKFMQVEYTELKAVHSPG